MKRMVSVFGNVFPLIALICGWLLLSGCDEDFIESTLIYNNDFEENLDLIEGGKTMEFMGSTVLGNYNNDGFTLRIPDFPSHNYINVRFTLHTHDSWDGNPVGNGGPDMWWMVVKRGKRYSQGDFIFATTFANSTCPYETFCLRQAYPNPYPFMTNSETGAISSSPGVCWFADRRDGTYTYQIDRTIAHSGATLELIVQDSLKQLNTQDPICDESWSIDNLEIFYWE